MGNNKLHYSSWYYSCLFRGITSIYINTENWNMGSCRFSTDETNKKNVDNCVFKPQTTLYVVMLPKFL